VQLGEVETENARALIQGPPRRPLARRLVVRFPADVFEELTAMAADAGLSRAGLVRHLAELGRQAMARQRTRDVELLALGALLAAEQGLELLQQIVPEGRYRAAVAREVAVAAAEARLSQLREQLAREAQ
jgi:hypothetical protein